MLNNLLTGDVVSRGSDSSEVCRVTRRQTQSSYSLHEGLAFCTCQQVSVLFRWLTSKFESTA